MELIYYVNSKERVIYYDLLIYSTLIINCAYIFTSTAILPDRSSY